MKYALLLLVILSTSLASAHEVQFIGQHLDIRRQKETGWQSDVLARATLSRKFEVGLQGTYLERFDFHEKRGGALLSYQPKENIILEGKILLGNGNEILPNQDYFLNGFWGLSDGFSPFFFYRNTNFSETHVQSVRVGLEIEKVSGFIIIPTFLTGKATFNSPASTKNIHNYGLKLVYYREAHYSFGIFGYKGKEASQGIIGTSNFLVDTTTGGVSASYYFIPSLRSEIIFDYTDYHELKNQFLTTTLNLAWRF